MICRQVGDRIGGRYEVFEVHRGGMGVVYEVEDLRAGGGPRHLALKTLDPELIGDGARGARFGRECRIWIGLGAHDHIVQAHAVETLERTPYLVLERAGGGELTRRIGTPELDPRRCVKLGVEFCLGMEHAVRRGLRCHRDVKPGNLLLSADGSLKITDFGIANVRDEFVNFTPEDMSKPIELDSGEVRAPIVFDDPRDRRSPSASSSAAAPRNVGPAPTPPTELGPDGDATTDFPAPRGPGSDVSTTTSFARLTRTGGLLGTLPYMAPEQFRAAAAVDLRADVYAFGVLFHQMITGVLPFTANSVALYERRHARDAPPSVAPRLAKGFAAAAPAIDALVGRCMAKNPADRFPDFFAVRKELTALWRRLR